MENFILIANSGIQFFSADLRIDLNSNFKLLFHEWFDEAKVEKDLEFAYCMSNSQQVYRWTDMRKRNFIDDNGKLQVSDAEVYADPNLKPLEGGVTIDNCSGFYYMKFSDKHCKRALESLYNQWIPLPFFELNALHEEMPHPYNWCRCKLIPRDSNDGAINLQVLFAFDTRSLYADMSKEDFPECPYFESLSENKKEFRFSSRKNLLIDFCSSGEKWLQSYLMSLIHNVSNLDDVQPDEKDNKYYFLASYMLLIEYMSKNMDLPKVVLCRDRNVEKIDVEMTIDIGNSRTAAILYEHDFSKVEMLHLQNFEEPLLENGLLNRTQESFDMAIAFQKVDFGKKSQENSCQFIWPSMVRLGVEANHLTHQTVNLKQGDEIYSTYSSPKRYLWDGKIRREEWRCVEVDKQGQNIPPIIEGISNYLNDDGSLEENGFGVGLHYSRRTLMTLAFMEILAQANVQINSFEYRDKVGRPSTPRYLDKIILTCPTGMSKNEQLALHQCLKDALFILQNFYKNNDESYTAHNVAIIPDLDNKKHKNQWIFDEATCSHFVYLYGLFTHTYQNCSKDFFSMYGKCRKNDNGQDVDSLRIGSLDIGAGTSDIMICQYNYNDQNSSCLKPIPIFWDSFDIAGDDMLRKLISNILLQGKDGVLEKEMLKKGWTEEQYRRQLYNFVGGDHREKSFKDRVLRRDFNLQVLVPIMYHFLQLHSNEVKYNINLKYDDIFKKEKPSKEVLDAFAKIFNCSLNPDNDDEGIVWEYDYDVLSRHIERSMDDLLRKIATIMYAYECDIILLSGRPTSLKPIKNIFLKYFPVAPNRLIILNKHRIGTWFSYVDEFGMINNSKSIVPLGAMIGYLASLGGGFNNFSLDLSVLGEKLQPTTECFLVNDTKANKNKSFITSKCQSGDVCEPSFPIYIGSKQFEISNYPIRPFYVLDFNEDAIINKINSEANGEVLTPDVLQQRSKEYKFKLLRFSPLKFTIERDDYQNGKEKLKITAVENSAQENLSTTDFQLSVQSLNDPDCYWLDSGSFEINIKAKTLKEN